jgi:hypothetical protein
VYRTPLSTSEKKCTVDCGKEKGKYERENLLPLN